jgi:hypothetical protein
MELIERKSDVLTGEGALEHLHTFANFPVFMGCVDHPQSEDVLVDSVWDIGVSSGLVQLKYLIPLNILYNTSHGSGDIGRIWDEHHRSFAAFVSRYNPNSVLEIGGGHGRLAKLYEDHFKIPWTIIEPNPAPESKSNAVWIKGFFNSSFISDSEYDCYVHSHLFEHLYYPCIFMDDLSTHMKVGDKLLFTLPNMQVMLEKNYTNCLNFEHTFLLTEPYIEYLLARNGFEVIGKEYFMEDHSIFYAAVRSSNLIETKLPPNLYIKNKELFLNFIKSHKEMISSYNNKLDQIGGPVYLFGAHVFAQFLIQMGLDLTLIVSIIDNDKNKQGKRLYGSNLMVESPAILSDTDNPIVILKAGVYNEEIKDDILNNINRNCIFWE